MQVEGAPVAVRQARAAKQGDELSNRQRATIRRDLRARQRTVAADVVDLGGEVLTKVQDAYNGVAVQIKARNVPRLAALPSVKSVRDVQLFRPTNADSVPFLGTPGVWENFGLTGENIKVGIIDTGIDYTHANFGGPGTEEAFADNDGTVIEPGTFPTDKVVGGFDFVGDDYDASSENPDINTAQPDPDPLDCNGHGSHVAGTAGGPGVLADGSTFDGPYDSTTHDNTFRVGPGVAPEADLFALRVFGCGGSASTEVIIQALDFAVEHDLDVVNMSLGSPYGRPDDPLSVASDNTVKAGVVVVASAGNSGEANYITDAPAAATRALSVAAMDSIATIDVADFTVNGETITLQNSNGADVAEPITGPVFVLQDDPETVEDESLGCTPEDFEGAQEGDIVVTFRGVCPRIDRAIIGQELNLAAVVFINDADGSPPVEGPIPGVDIPFLGATPEQEEFLVAADGETATITDAGTVPNPTFRTLASFTSNGPRNGDSGAKPEIAGPGVSINSALVGSGTEGTRLSGTSMSAPHVAGVAALHREAHPNWSVVHTKAALVNTAEPDQIVDYSVSRAGAGLVDPQDAVRTPVVAVTGPASASLSFGFAETERRITKTQQITLRNHSDTAHTYITRADMDADAGGGASVCVHAPRVRVPAKGSRVVRVRFHFDASEAPTGFTPATGNVVFSPIRPVFGGSQLSDLRVPYVAVPRAISDIETRPGRVGADEAEANFRTHNRSAVPGTADVYAWGLEDRREGLATNDVRAVGVQAFPDDDIGVFAFNTYSDVSNPAVNEWDVLLDTDDDGEHEFAVIGFDIGPVLGVLEGFLGSFTVNLETGEIVNAFFAGGGLNTSTVLLPFQLSDVGLAPDSDSDFSYITGVFSQEGLAFGDEIVDGVGHFDAFSQPVETGAFFELGPRERIRWRAGINREQLADTPVRGFMIVNAENHTGRRQASLIRVNR